LRPGAAVEELRLFRAALSDWPKPVLVILTGPFEEPRTAPRFAAPPSSGTARGPEGAGKFGASRHGLSATGFTFRPDYLRLQSRRREQPIEQRGDGGGGVPEQLSPIIDGGFPRTHKLGGAIWSANHEGDNMVYLRW
jgi:hypothetical protein